MSHYTCPHCFRLIEWGFVDYDSDILGWVHFEDNEALCKCICPTQAEPIVSTGNVDTIAAYNQGREDEKAVFLYWVRYWNAIPNSPSEIITAVEENKHRAGRHLPKEA